MKPVDWKARDRIINDLDTTFLVEAGAGSGKTKSLVDRMLALLRSGACPIHTLAAVTFTRKAAAELRERFQTQLEKEYAAAGDEPVRLRLGESMRNLEQCFIGTIHSFCARMLRERPIAIDLPPDFEELDDVDNAVFREQCWYDYLTEVRSEHPDAVSALEEVGLEPESLKNAFDSVTEFPEVDWACGCETPPDFASLRRSLETFCFRAEKVIPSDAESPQRDAMQKRMIRLAVRRRNIGFADPLVLMDTLESLDSEIGITQKRWPDKETAKELKRDFDTFRRDVIKPALIGWREHRHTRAVRFLRPAVRSFEEKRRLRSLVNFTDLLQMTARLLRDNPDIRGYFQRKFTHLLVDEFQDTDPIQAEMLLFLTGTDARETDWRKLSPRPGALFLVGDPKQSIYRFRRADIDTYNAVRDQILRAGGEVLRLTANFRSLQPLADWNNPLFQQTFPASADRHQAAFAPLNTVRKEQEGCCSGIYKITIGKKPFHRRDDIVSEDAGIIADWIRWACDGSARFARTPDETARGLSEKARPSDFLILFRYKKRMDAYARALEERDIPFEISGSQAFSASPDIREIVNLALALKDPDDPVYTTAVLRGVFFGVSDDALMQFKRAGGRFSFVVPPRIRGRKGAEYVADCLSVMHQWWLFSRGLPASTALEVMLERSGLIPYLAASPMGSGKSGNLFKLLEFIRHQERRGDTSFAAVADFMRDLISVRDVEETSLTPARTDAVRLMNLHKAKGLEAPVVFLANPAGTRPRPPDKHIVRSDTDVPRGYFVFSQRGLYKDRILSQPENWASRSNEEALYLKAEDDRLMYVAATRAKNMLVISTYDGAMANKSWGLLDQNLIGVPELEAAVPADRPPREILTVNPDELEAAAAKTRLGVAAAVQPSYRVESVTSLAKGEGAYPGGRVPAGGGNGGGGEDGGTDSKDDASDWGGSDPGRSWSGEDTGRGMSWGRVVHKTLEAMGRGASGEELEKIAENALLNEEWDPYEMHELMRLVREIEASAFWQRMQAAPQRYFEIPFSHKVEPDAPDTPPLIVSGTIDLIFRESDGWVIVDYKSDAVDGGGEGPSLESLVEYYAPQVKMYAAFWSEITGDAVKEAGLYFTTLRRWVKVI